MKTALEGLRRFDLIKRSRINVQKITSLRRRSIQKIAADISEKTRLANCPRPRDPRASHCPALSICGDPNGYCQELSCRLDAVERLARFTAMYSDTVYVPNPLAYHTDGHSYDDWPLEAQRKRLFEDLVVITRLAPLIRSGHVFLVTPVLHLCSKCAENHRPKYQLTQARRRLAKQYLAAIESAEIRKVGQYYLLAVRGPADLFHENFAGFQARRCPQQLQKMPRKYQQLEDGHVVSISRTALQTIGIHRWLASKAVGRASFGLTFSELLGTSYVTDSQLDLSYMQSTSIDRAIAQRNKIIADHLCSLLPFLPDVPLTSIIKLRKNEGDAFLAFRQALQHIIDNAANVDKPFTSADAQQLYSDVLRPELAKLSSMLSKRRRTLVSQATRQTIAAFGAGTLTFGIYSGLATATVPAVAATLGALGTAQIIMKWLNAQDARDAVSQHHLYFLLRVQHQSRESTG